jgi:hypothetical protein
VDSTDRVKIQSFIPEDLSFNDIKNFTSDRNSISMTIELGSKKELVLIINK